MVHLSFVLSVTGTYHLCISVENTGGGEGGQGRECTSSWTPFVGAHVRIHINRNYMGGTGYCTLARIHFIKKISSRNQTDVGSMYE